MRVLVNSLPKSGTNLLGGVVRLLGYEPVGSRRGALYKAAARLGLAPPVSLTSESATRSLARRLERLLHPRAEMIPTGVTSPVDVPAPLVCRWLGCVPEGCALSGHLPWSEPLERILAALEFRHVLILRDPRDVLVSFLHYVTREGHRLEPDLRGLSPDERVALVLRGGRGPRTGARIVGLADALRSVLAWRRSPRCTLVRFEDLVGEEGGGSARRQHETVLRIAAALGRALDPGAAQGVCKGAFDPRSRTFRQGRIGSFREALTPAQRALAEAALGEELLELGRVV